MLKQQRPPSMFVGGNAALDFLNSIAAPRSTEFDWLETGPDLLNWLVQAGLCVEAEIEHLRADSHYADLKQATQSVRKFRNEFRDFVHSASKLSKVPIEHPLIYQINHLLTKGTQRLKIEFEEEHFSKSPSAHPIALKSIHTFQTAQDLLPRVAAACADFICEADFHYVRNCEGPTCTLFFLDVSKNHKRRWCSMDVCGNRAKATAHRNR